MIRRPIFATDDSILAESIGKEASVWEPGGNLQQFHRLCRRLNVTELRDADTSITEFDEGVVDEDATTVFEAAVRLLGDDLLRNDAAVSASLVCSWEELAACETIIRAKATGLLGLRCQWEHCCCRPRVL